MAPANAADPFWTDFVLCVLLSSDDVISASILPCLL